MIKKLLYISLTINLLVLISCFVILNRVGGLKYLLIRLERPFGADHDDMVSLFKILPDREGEIVFLGNSMTFHGQWAEFFENSKCINRGIGGDDSERILSRLDEITNRKPDKIFMEAGINDLGKGRSIDYIMDNYKQIVQTLRKHSPLTKLYLQSVLPINNDIRNHRRSNNDIKILNEKIKQLAAEYDATYIDLFTHFIDSDGMLSRELTSDGVHINGQGYLLWKENIYDYVMK